MAKRTVFGRRRVALDSGRYTFEMKEDGVYMRRLHGRELVTVPFDHLVKLFARQLMLNYDPPLDTSNKNEPVPGVRQGDVVSSESGREVMSLHEGGEPQAEDAVRWEYGVGPLLGPPYPTPEQWAQLQPTHPADNQLPTTD